MQWALLRGLVKGVGVTHEIGMFPQVMALFCGWMLAMAVLHAAPTAHREEMLMRHWRTIDGLPHNRIRSVVRTQDGFIWLATDGGAVRFDGANFTVFSLREGLPAPIVLALRETEDRTLWLATLGGGLSSFRNGSIVNTYTTADGLPSNWVSGIEVDETGTLVATTLSGAARLVGKRFVPIQRKANSPRALRSVMRDGSGALWGIGRDRFLYTWRDGAWVQIHEAGQLKTDALTIDARGRLWTAGLGKLWCHEGGVWSTHSLPAEFQGSATSIAASPDGTVWLAFHRYGLCGFKDGRFITPAPTAGFSPDQVETVTATSDGQLWITTAYGLYRLDASRIRTCLIDDPKSPSAANILGGLVEVSPEVFIIATQGSGFYRWENGHATRLSDDPGLGAGISGNTVVKADDGTIWLGANNGLFELKQDGSTRKHPLPQNPNTPVWALASTPEGLWVGTGHGRLHLLVNGKFQTIDYGGSMEPIKAFAREPDGTFWVGTRGNGLFRRGSKGEWRRLDHSNIIRCLYLDPEGRLWVGSDGGGVSLRLDDERFISVTSFEGLPSSSISQIQMDAHGRLWVGSNRGIAVFDKESIASIAAGRTKDLHPLLINEADGMTSSELTIVPPITTSDGTTAFATHHGFIRLRMDDFQPDQTRPPVFMEGLRANGNEIHLTPKLISLPAGTDRLEFSFTGLNYRDPSRLKFRNRLTGIDDDWAQIGDRRFTEYRNLKPGTYQFQVEATTGNGLWSAQPAVVKIVISPYFWQTLWFRILVVIASLGVVALGARVIERRRSRRAIEFMRRRRAVDAERARIARDLHDDVGASLTQMALQSQLVERNLTRQPERAASYLRDIFKTASRMTRTLDEIIWAVNPSHDTLENFILFLESHTQDVAEAAGLRSRFDLPDSIPSRMMPSNVRHHLYLAAKEVLHNVVKHADASEVSLQVKLGDHECSILISDDGKGFKEGAAGLGEDGLINMRNRLEQIRGVCTRHSAPGQGTSVEMRVPMSWWNG